ncbi:MAG TPA: 50S ribosomal protein L17 [Polyangia bacterium]
MRHQRAGLHLSRTAAHRKALFSNLVSALFTYERIRTTDAKAKETRRIAERTITWARRLGDVLTKPAEKRTPEESARVVHAVRMARRVVRDRSAIVKLFEDIGPRFLARRGGYTRIVKVGQRPGDAAPMSLLELVPDANAKEKPVVDTEAAETSAKAGKGGKGEKKASTKAAKPAATEASAKPKRASTKAAGEPKAKAAKATKAGKDK